MQFVLFITYISVVVYVAHTADVTTYSCVLCDLCSARRHRSEIAVKSIFITVINSAIYYRQVTLLSGCVVTMLVNTIV